MAVERNPQGKSPFADKLALRKAVEAHNLRTGFVPDPTATPQKAREMMRAEGIRAEDNEASRGIIAMRDEE